MPSDPRSTAPDRPRVDVFRLPRFGSRPEEYEDAAAVSEPAAGPLRAAVADGATETAFSGLWARLLVEASVEAGLTLRAGDPALARCREAWRAEVGRKTTDAAWYVAAKAAEGAYAALLAFTLHPDGRYEAAAVGDCNLFHLRGAEVVRTWPFETPEAFTFRPALLGSLPESSDPAATTSSGVWHPGDVFLLATDAAAAWLLGASAFEAAAGDAAYFETEVAAARAKGRLRNDDVALLRIRC